MSIITLSSFTLHSTLDKETQMWITQCLMCHFYTLTDSKNEGILGFTGHICKES